MSARAFGHGGNPPNVLQFKIGRTGGIPHEHGGEAAYYRSMIRGNGDGNMTNSAPIVRALAGTAMFIAAASAVPAMAQSMPGAGVAAAPANAAAPYRQHVADMVVQDNWYDIERRGYKAQRARPNFEVRSVDDLTVYERRDLDRLGRKAQRVRGTRPQTHRVATSHTRTPAKAAMQSQYPGRARLDAGLTNRGNKAAPKFRTNAVQRGGPTLLRAASKASNLDLGAELIGGRDVGATRFASDMSIGQVSNALRGGDPVASAVHSTNRLGRNLESGLIGIGQSIRDPRRIPGNVSRTVEGTARAAVDTTRYVGETAVKTVRDGARFVTDPGFASRQVKKAGGAINNVGKSVCKGLSHFIPGSNKKKCK